MNIDSDRYGFYCACDACYQSMYRDYETDRIYCKDCVEKRTDTLKPPSQDIDENSSQRPMKRRMKRNYGHTNIKGMTEEDYRTHSVYIEVTKEDEKKEEDSDSNDD